MGIAVPEHTEATRAVLERHGYEDVRALGGQSVTYLLEATVDGTRCLVTTRSSRVNAGVPTQLDYAAPGILPLRGIFTLDEVTVLVEELGAGVPVVDTLSPEELVFVVGSIGRTLQALHAAGRLAHGLRPEMIFTRGDAGQRRLAGYTPRQLVFLTGAFDAVLDGVHLFTELWSPLDAAPSTASDVFSLAACAVKLATGHHPFTDDRYKQLPAMMRGERGGPRLAGGFGALIDRALATDPAARPQLGALLDGLAVSR